MATKKFFFGHGSFSIRDGSEIHFWDDKWLGNTTLREQYPALYSVVRHKGDTLAHVLGSRPPNVTFRRTLFGPRLVNWEALIQRMTNIQLTTEKDIFRWNLHENGKFSVAYIYNALIIPDVPVYDNKKKDNIYSTMLDRTEFIRTNLPPMDNSLPFQLLNRNCSLSSTIFHSSFVSLRK
jgi:hypothetical protein